MRKVPILRLSRPILRKRTAIIATSSSTPAPATPITSPAPELRVPHNIWTDYFNTNPDDFWKLYCLCNDTASGYQGSYRNNLKNYVEIIAARLFALLYTLTTVATRKAISTIPCQKLTIARPGRGPSTFLPTVEKPTAFLIRFILYQRVDVQKEVAIGYIRGMHARRCEGVLYLNNRQRN